MSKKTRLKVKVKYCDTLEYKRPAKIYRVIINNAHMFLWFKPGGGYKSYGFRSTKPYDTDYRFFSGRKKMMAAFIARVKEVIKQ